MKIAFLVNKDVHSNIALNLLRPFLGQHNVTILMTEKVGAPGSDYVRPTELTQLAYLEQDFFCNIVSPMAEQQTPCRERFRTFRELGAETGRDVQIVPNINAPAGLAALESAEPDLAISIRYGSILRDAAIAVPRLGVLNLHSGLLPRYKGILTTLHALAAGETAVGCTLHRIDSASIDTGPIVATTSVPVDPQQSLLWHVLQIYPAGCALIGDAITRLANDETLPAETQDNDGQPYFSLPSAADFQKLRDRGFAVWQGQDLTTLYSRYR